MKVLYCTCKHLGRAAERARAIAEADALFAQAEVGHFHVSIFVEEQVIQLNAQGLIL